MDLFLIRHGEALGLGPGVSEDARRPLTDRGRKLLRLAGPGIRARGIAPAVILSSPYRRAMETSELLLEALSPAHGLLVLPALASGAAPEDLLEAATDHQALGSVMIVGHNPEIDTAARLLASRTHQKLQPTLPGTLTWFRSAALPPGSAPTLEGQWPIESWTAV